MEEFYLHTPTAKGLEVDWFTIWVSIENGIFLPLVKAFLYALIHSARYR